MRITVLFRNASARCCAPFSPIWFEERSSVVSVCVKKCRWVYVLSRWRERERWGLLCCFVMHQPDVVLLYLRFDSRRDLVWWVSVWKSADGYTYCLDEERERERMRITVLFRNASARCCAPLSPIWLSRRFSVMNVCVKKCRWVYVLSRWREREREWGLRCCFVMHQPDVVLLYLRFDCWRDVVWWVSVWKSADGYTYCLDEERERERERMRITVLFRNASARCCAPLSPIWFLERSSVVSVCVKKCRWVYVLSRWREREREWGLRCCFVMHQPDVVLLSLWFDCRWDLVWWVSVWKSADGYTYCLDEERERENEDYGVVS